MISYFSRRRQVGSGTPTLRLELVLPTVSWFCVGLQSSRDVSSNWGCSAPIQGRTRDISAICLTCSTLCSACEFVGGFLCVFATARLVLCLCWFFQFCFVFARTRFWVIMAYNDTWDQVRIRGIVYFLNDLSGNRLLSRGNYCNFSWSCGECKFMFYGYVDGRKYLIT